MWWLIAVFIVSLVLSFAMPRPHVDQPAALQTVTAPTAQVGKEIGVLFGTRLLEDPNVVWYGAVRTVPIKKKGGKK